MPTSNSTLCADDHRYDHPLSLRSIMGKFELLSGSVLGRRTISQTFEPTNQRHSRISANQDLQLSQSAI